MNPPSQMFEGMLNIPLSEIKISYIHTFKIIRKKGLIFNTFYQLLDGNESPSEVSWSLSSWWSPSLFPSSGSSSTSSAPPPSPASTSSSPPSSSCASSTATRQGRCPCLWGSTAGTWSSLGSSAWACPSTRWNWNFYQDRFFHPQAIDSLVEEFQKGEVTPFDNLFYCQPSL